MSISSGPNHADKTREGDGAEGQGKTMGAHAMDMMKQTSALVVDDLTQSMDGSARVGFVASQIFSFFIAKDSDNTEQGHGKKGTAEGAEEGSQAALPTVEGEGFRVLIRGQVITPGPPGVVLDFGKVEVGKPQTERVVVSNLENEPVVFSLNCPYTAMAEYRLRLDGQPFAGYSVKGVVDQRQSRDFLIEFEAVDTGCESDVAAVSLTVGGYVHDITIRGCGVATKQ